MEDINKQAEERYPYQSTDTEEDQLIRNSMRRAYKAGHSSRDEEVRETWGRACKITLLYVADTFRQNLHRAEKISDRAVFEAIADTLKNHPIPDFVQTNNHESE